MSEYEYREERERRERGEERRGEERERGERDLLPPFQRIHIARDSEAMYVTT